MTIEDKRKEIKGLIKDLAILEKQMNIYISQSYFNSQPIVSLNFFDPNKKVVDLIFKLSDVLLIGALTQSHVLLSGSSGSGKTLLAERMAEFLFGTNGYSRKNITPDMNEQDFIDIDFGVIKGGGTLKEAMKADTLFDNPCLIIDEANRAPPIVQNRLMQILENNIDLKSKIIHAGVLLEKNLYYHWNILTLNYGVEYTGTSAVDRALKDRVTLDIPIDNFPPNLDDQIMMIRDSLVSNEVEKPSSVDNLIYQIYRKMGNIQLSLEAEALILYLSFTSNCIKSPTGSKYGVIFSPQYCKDQDCEYARNPPLNRSLNDSEAIDKYLNLQDFDVTLEDVISVAPVILNSKISMNRDWVMSRFNGNILLACNHFLKIINQQLDYFMKNLLEPFVSEMKGRDLSEKQKGIRKKALQDDFHYKGLMKYVKKYLT